MDKPVSEMVRRVAEAIAVISSGSPDNWGNCVEEAIEAIKAMREPTTDMTDQPSYVNGEWSRRNIEAFIDAALGDTNAA